MRKFKKYFIFAILFIFLSLGVGYISVANAESGWDYDYDTGGSWDYDYDSGSSWDYDSGSSWDYDYSGGSSYYGGSSSGGTTYSSDEIMSVLITTIVIVVICCFIGVLGLNKKYKSPIKHNSSILNNHSQNYRELSIEEINKIDSSLSKEEMNKLVFKLYKDIQDAWMNFDYDTLRKYTTDELFHMYESQLKVLQAKKQKNIMSDIKFKYAKIININIQNGVEKVTMYLNTITTDYVIDANGKIVRGSDKIRNDMEYLITLNRNMEKVNIKNCPSCGAEINIVSGGQCPYCDNVIVNNNEEFVMSKKECIGQRRAS